MSENEKKQTGNYGASSITVLEGLEAEFRSLLSASRNYRILYFIDDDTAFIFRIWDCRQNPEKMKKSALKSRIKNKPI